MQKYPLIDLREVENVTRLGRVQPLDVTQRHHGALTRRQFCNRFLGHRKRFPTKQHLLRSVVVPQAGWGRPGTSGGEPVRRDSGLIVERLECLVGQRGPVESVP